MVSLRGRLWSAIALVLGVLLAVSGLTAPAQAATARSLGLAASPTTTTTGSQVTFSGRLTRSPKGSAVRIQRKAGTKWVAVTSTRTTTATGRYAVKATMPSKAAVFSFRAVAPKTAHLATATSKTVKVTVLRRVTATIKATPSTIALGDATTLSGTVSPFVAGTVATIQRFNGATWTAVTTATITKRGTYSRSFHPIATTTYRVVVPRTGLNAGAASAPTVLSIPSGPVAPVITTSSLPDGYTDTAYSQTLTKTGEAGTWSVTGGALPGGLTLNASTGEIAGTPAAGGTFAFTVTYSETATALNDSQQLSIHVRVKPRITTISLPNATGYVTYSTTLTKTGNAGTWSLTGSLPTGLSFDNATGVLSGKPTTTTAADFPLSFTFTETADPTLTVTKSLTLHLNAAPAPVITTTSLPNATGYVTYSTTLAKTGNPGTWSLTAGALPAGLGLDAATGVISGKPTTTAAADFSPTFTFTETESGTFASKQLNLHLNAAPAPTITTTSLPFATTDAAYGQTLAKTGNPGTWAVTAGALPTGITLNPNTGALTGTPSVTGTFTPTFTFTETESGLSSAGKQLTLKVYAQPTITTTSLPDGTRGQSYSQQLTASGGSGSGTWSLVSGSLPPGLSLSTSGLISGTPSTITDASFTVRYTDAVAGLSAPTRALAIHTAMAGAPTILTSSLPDAQVGVAYSQQLDGSPAFGSWAVVSGALPAGLSLNGFTGVISGTPTTPGLASFTVKYTVFLTNNTKQLTINVLP